MCSLAIWRHTYFLQVHKIQGYRTLWHLYLRNQMFFLHVIEWIFTKRMTSETTLCYRMTRHSSSSNIFIQLESIATRSRVEFYSISIQSRSGHYSHSSRGTFNFLQLVPSGWLLKETCAVKLTNFFVVWWMWTFRTHVIPCTWLTIGNFYNRNRTPIKTAEMIFSCQNSRESE